MYVIIAVICVLLCRQRPTPEIQFSSTTATSGTESERDEIVAGLGSGRGEPLGRDAVAVAVQPAPPGPVFATPAAPVQGNQDRQSAIGETLAASCWPSATGHTWQVSCWQSAIGQTPRNCCSAPEGPASQAAGPTQRGAGWQLAIGNISSDTPLARISDPRRLGGNVAAAGRGGFSDLGDFRPTRKSSEQTGGAAGMPGAECQATQGPARASTAADRRRGGIQHGDRHGTLATAQRAARRSAVLPMQLCEAPRGDCTGDALVFSPSPISRRPLAPGLRCVFLGGPPPPPRKPCGAAGERCARLRVRSPQVHLPWPMGQVA